MASKIGTIRTAYKDQISSEKTAGNYVTNTFSLVEAVKPFSDLTDLTTPKVTVIGAGFNKEYVTRGRSGKMTIPIYVAVQKQLTDNSSVSEIDEMLELMEQIMEDAADVSAANYRLTDLEMLLDENEMPYSFQRLREKSLFESYMTANFLYTE